MNYTLATLRTTLRNRLQDQDYDESVLDQFINDSQLEILGEDKYPFLERIDGPFRAGAGGELDLPWDYQATLQVYARQKKGHPRELLHYVAPKDFFDQDHDRLYTYTTYGRLLYYKLPLVKKDDGWCCPCPYEIMHLYLARPKVMEADDDSPIIPPEYSEALILGALARAEERRGNFDYAQLYRNKQNELVINMKLRFGPGQQSMENTARLPFGGNYDGRF